MTSPDPAAGRSRALASPGSHAPAGTAWLPDIVRYAFGRIGISVQSRLDLGSVMCPPEAPACHLACPYPSQTQGQLSGRRRPCVRSRRSLQSPCPAARLSHPDLHMIGCGHNKVPGATPPSRLLAFYVLPILLSSPTNFSIAIIKTQ